MEEQRKQADKLMTGLSKNKGASKGNANARGDSGRIL